MPDLSKFILIEKRSLTRWSLAVFPRDISVADLRPNGKLEVRLTNHPRKAIQNLRGYHIYYQLENGEYWVEIDADYYLPRRFLVPLPLPAPPPGDDDVTLTDINGAVLAEVDLQPGVTYPFPSGATLVQGEVLDPAGNPLRNATITVTSTTGGASVSGFEVDHKGQFVLFCNPITHDEIIKINGKAFGGGRNLTLQAFDPDLGASPTEDLTVEEGKRVFRCLQY
ncbi:MAG: carboxypeptidase regulatory-like domain-containing protein [Calditrichaeota bacterium]|nr:carboxypeptidase regulatory-like domain-containing protein [Calditrichota bacterium]MCB9088569.1 carboxypeptidase regulatory-like domain-containing protein [Calditrichia bacterium]MCB0288622.1 carboxypeptidase regulatory-like domain-containing protein [Calditrichota bacterium]MCB0294150.1 carboxypeptidase regulatory-like domain-containing protein [Calditrichota bacterium]MCB0302454.1 carboxypeptidase regulatory-like domain-containing protein [Calditrichota bacterium]